MKEYFLNVYELNGIKWMDVWPHPSREHAKAHTTWFPNSRRIYLLRVKLKEKAT
jgi:hypothetical protein